MKQDIIRFIDTYVKELENGTAAIFAGAGLSMLSGFVNWKELLRPIADEMELDVERENDLATLAQFHLNKHRNNRAELTQIVIDGFAKKVETTVNHEILSRLPIETFWTTNYDKLIEQSLEQASKIPDVKFGVPHLAQTVRNRDAVVYKMHGDISQPHEVIFTRNDYEAYHLKYQPFITALSGDLVDKTFLFVGFSFSDQNLEYVLSRIRTTFANNQRKHYCILKSVKKNDDEDDGSFEYRKRRHNLIIADLLNYNIHALEIDKYSEVTEILNAIERVYRKRTVFISGSAHEYGEWGDDRAEKFIVDLGRRLIEARYKIVTGMGLGVGNSIISGALDQIYMNQKNILRDEIVMRPFPQTNDDTAILYELWEAYRQDMTSYAGISIFLFGNKINKEGKIVDADGVKREFEIAKEKGHALLPIGATGYVAEELWNEVLNNFDTYYQNAPKALKEKFEKLGDKKLDEDALMVNLIRLLKELVK